MQQDMVEINGVRFDAGQILSYFRPKVFPQDTEETQYQITLQSITGQTIRIPVGRVPSEGLMFPAEIYDALDEHFKVKFLET